jgi:hypothetical protein
MANVPDPQLKLQIPQQTLKPASVPARFHPHPHAQTACLHLPIKLLSFFPMSWPPFATLSGFCVPQCHLLKTRMIVTTLVSCLHLPDSVSLC